MDDGSRIPRIFLLDSVRSVIVMMQDYGNRNGKYLAVSKLQTYGRSV